MSPRGDIFLKIFEKNFELCKSIKKRKKKIKQNKKIKN